MAKFRAKQLLRLCESHGASAVMKHLKAATDEKKVSLSDYSIKDLAHTFLGESWGAKFRHLSSDDGFRIEEAAGQPVKSTLFSNITGQLLFSEIRKQFDSEAFVFSGLVPTVATAIDGTETVPSIGNMGDVSESVGEGQEYPSVGVTEGYWTIPLKTKRGMKIEVTEESIFFDRTNLLVEAAANVGQSLAIRKEKDIIDVFSGQTNNYSRNGTATNTYLLSGAYVNNQSGTDLVDWSDIDSAELLFADILDPTTSEPLADLPASERQLVVMPHRVHTAKRILGATEVRDTAGSNFETLSANTVAPYTLVSSRLLYRQVLSVLETVAATAQAIWWLGSIQRAFAWYENWPLAVFRQGGESNAGFERDISMRFKARYRGVAVVREPRWITRNENAAV